MESKLIENIGQVLSREDWDDGVKLAEISTVMSAFTSLTEARKKAWLEIERLNAAVLKEY